MLQPPSDGPHDPRYEPMIKVLNSDQMRACDAAAIEGYRIPSVVLMENAGSQVVETMIDWFGEAQPFSIAVVCGKGNNGGDGLVIARHLHNLGREVLVYMLAPTDQIKGDPGTNLRIVEALGIEVVECAGKPIDFSGFDCIVDAVLGTGLACAARAPMADAIEAINSSGVPVVSVDLPSGLSSDSGRIPGATVAADLTVTLAAPKLCCVLGPAEELCGDLVVVDIGIPHEVIDGVEDAVQLLTPAHCARLLRARESDSHKGTFGHVLIVAGALGTTGAAALTANAATRSGAGLVTVATPERVYPIVAAKLDEPLVKPLPDSNKGELGAGAENSILELCATVDVLALGPGIGTSEEVVAVVEEVLSVAEVPAVIDADGLNAYAGRAEQLRSGAPRILTPHPGEAARLLGRSTAEVQEDRIGTALQLAELTGAVVVLKGHRTVIADSDGRVAINPTGNPGMATGGSGDVLAGLIAGWLAQDEVAHGPTESRSTRAEIRGFSAACLGTFLHGLAGDRAAKNLGEISLAAGDLLGELPSAIESIRAGVHDLVDLEAAGD